MKITYRFFFLVFLIFSFQILHAQEQADVNKKLLLAVYKGDAKEVSQLLADSADVNAATDEGISALMYASEKGFTEIVKILLYNMADPNLKPANGRTALMSAAMQNYQEIVYLLLVYGADINATDEYGVTALMYAASYNLYDMVDYLLKNGAQHVIKAQDGTDALLAASYFGNSDIVSLLCSYNADVNTKDYSGFTPFTVAIQNNDGLLADTLIRHQSDFKTYFKDHPSINMVDYARIYNQKPIVKKLKKLGMHGSFWPFFNKLTLNYNIGSFSTKDYFMGAGIGIYDSKYDLSFEFGLNGRVAQKRVLEPLSENEYLQLWEKRRYVYLGAEKLIRFKTKNNNHRQGIFIRARGLYTFGSYQGLSRKPEGRFVFTPGAGYSYMFKTWFLKAAYEYCDLGIYNGMNHWITITAGLSINLSKNKLQKNIYWTE
ncbi:MAG TPA: ankyrin repeat domain-containing protein [Bacteroidales bacterium]|nr:ankyrin repeat domain-containing protein [Bacteroidales bacterium]